MQSNKQNSKETPRNSRLREFSRMPTEKIAQLLHTVFPWLTPNELTLLGAAGLGGLVLYTAKLEKEGKIDFKTSLQLLGLFLGISGSDALDGALARYKRKIGEEGTHDSSVGQLVDSLSDRVQEAFSSWLAMYRAAEQGDKLWLVTATLSAFTNPLSSLVRAYAEKNGIVVPESGKNVLEFLGTRVGRFGVGTLHYVTPIQVGGTSVQGIADGLTAAATVKTTVSRVEAVRSHKKTGGNVANELPIEVKKDAERRFKLLAGLAVITGTTTAFLLHKLLRKK